MSMTKSLSVLTLALSAAASAEPAETLKQQVDELYAALNNSDTPGCAVGVIHRGNYIHTAGYGMANLELGVALDADSVFRIGSVSKQFTAMAVHLMAQDGLIDLDADIHTYLPDLVNYDTEVTIRTMLGHVSGLPDYEDSLVTGTGDNASAYALQSAAGGPFRMVNADYLTIAEFYDVGNGISVNTAELSEKAREEYLRATADATGLPCVDPLVTGVGPLVDHMAGEMYPVDRPGSSSAAQ